MLGPAGWCYNPRMKRPGRKIMAVLAILAGLLVGVFESIHASSSSSGEVWFWSTVAALMIVLGMAELLSWDHEK